jgi:hypothetical protein
LPTLLHLHRLACRRRRAAESCIPGNHRIRRRHRGPETGPNVERAIILPLALLSSPPVRVMGLAALCTRRSLAIRAQSCTNEKSPPVPNPRITVANHYYLEEIGFDSPNCAQPVPAWVHPRRLQPEPPRLRLASSGRTGSSSFPLHPKRRPTNSRGFVSTLSSAIRAQRCTKPKSLPLAAPWITNTNRATSRNWLPSARTPAGIRGPRQRTCRADGCPKRTGFAARPHFLMTDKLQTITFSVREW